ncbi:hypothetical protein [Methylobacterium goesingense]|uniref:Uncharacterized protein n=1 Tax=Methylobacterium goesingense TaxID=243690 RepID=A0ABV2L3J0_9HYPH|nr:hypothetical protein [Methylobacterium goesingense]GJD76760.1 hypothetical protein CFIICLFH_5019 [Methylobacterium goesingense]
MTLTVSLNRVGLVRATEILHQARNDAARRHQTELQTVTVALDRPSEPAPTASAAPPPGQDRVVDLQV